MLRPPFQDALVLTGPTGCGKSVLALELAPCLNAEIASMDSMALYRGMDIGTAKPIKADQAVVPHHLIDVLEPWESSSVAWWLERAKACCFELASRGKRALFVGGTPLYLKALIAGLFDGPPADADFRAAMEEEAESLGSAELHRRLAEIDPVAAQRLHVNDRRRIIRALEVHHLTGRPISDWQQEWSAPRLESEFPAVLWVDLPREELYDRINRRVDAMFEAGLVDEVRRVSSLGKPLSREASQALGYKEVFAYLDGLAPLEATIEHIKTRTRNFAKRQITWFRHLRGCRPATKELTATLWQSKMK